MVRPMAHVLRESWKISYLHSFGRKGSDLVDLLARRSGSEDLSAEPDEDKQLVGTVIAFASLAPGAGRPGWSVLACIDLDACGTVFGRVVTDLPWKPRSIHRQMRIGRRVAPVACAPEVRSLADLAFVLVD